VWDAAGAITREHYPAVPSPQTHRRALLAGAAAAVAVGTSLTWWQSAQASVYETDVGVQKHIELSDHTAVFLDTDTKIRAAFDSDSRAVDLFRGQANFRVASDTRPFVVSAAGHRVVASQASLDVRKDDLTVSVLLLQGRAVLTSRDRKHTHLLKRGDRVIARSAGQDLVDRPNLGPLVAWQTGQAMFDDEMLSDAIREMNRYSDVKLTVADAQTARLRISGVYRVGDNLALAQSLVLLLPVKMETHGGQIQLALDRRRVPTE
jgi:transmembrane sensor